VRFALVDVVKQVQLAAMTYTVMPAQFRATAHKIADVIYEKLTGDVGVFSTRIAYITKQGPRYELLVADADGNSPQAVVSSNEPLLSPSWSPDGSRIAYVSLENKKPIVYVQSLATGQRQVLANFRGSNSAPTWAPDGRKLIVTLTKDGGSQLFLINADGTGVQRLLSSPGIDTEASFAPDGQSVLFTSDRGGTPQIYRLQLGSNAIERLTFDGSYNVSPRATPDGKGFVFVRRDGGRFMLGIQDFATRQVQILTQGPLDESPSIAPNSRLVIYAAHQGERGILAAVSSDGRVKQRLVSPAADVREPAWGPLVR
jgi:TolB protein